MDEIEIVRMLPAPPAASALERQRIRSRLVHAIAHSPAVRHPALPWGRRLRRPLLVAVGLLLLAGTVSAVGAGVFEEWGGPGHEVSEAAIRAEIADTERAIALPPGESYPDLFPYYAVPHNLVQYLGVQRVQFHAMCRWSDYWLASNVKGDKQGLAAATAVIARFPRWQSIADRRLADDSVRSLIDRVVAGAVAGNPAPIREFVQATCPVTGS